MDGAALGEREPPITRGNQAENLGKTARVR